MKPVNIIGEYCSIPIPKEGMSFQLWGTHSADSIRYLTMPEPGKFKSHAIMIPSSKWSIVSTSDEMTEEQAKGIVDSPLSEYDDGDLLYLHYGHSQNEWPYVYETALQSFQSLLKSHGLTGRQLIIKKEL